MSLKIVRCGLNCDAGREYFAEMKKVPADKKVVLIVPDQYSYMAERKMAQVFGGTGLNGKFVYTFRQMKRTFLNLRDRRYLSASGKRMLLKSVIQRTIDESSVFYKSRNGSGFTENLNGLLCELKRYCISAESLKKAGENAKSKILQNKLLTVCEVFSEFEKSLKNGDFLDSEDDFSRLSAVLRENGYFKDSYVFIDLFTDFSPQHLSVLAEILASGAKVSIYLPAKKDGEVFENSLYEFPEKTVSTLKRLCVNLGIEVTEKEADNLKKMKPAIFAYSENFELPGFKYENPAEEIKIFQAKEKYSEVEYAALKISDLVREEGLKFSEISVVCGDLEEYISFIEPLFFEYHIPYFSDYKVSLSDNPVAVLITSLFDILDNNSFSFDACMRYLRTGFLVSDRDADLIENHILKRGIKGSMWQNPKYWTEDKKVFDDITGAKSHISSEYGEYLNSVRKTVIEPILNFCEKTKGRKTVRAMCEALFEFVSDIELYDKISSMAEHLKSIGRESEAMRFEQVFNFIVEITEQAVVALGESLVTREEFYELIVDAMSECKISIIPTIADGVSVSDASRGVTDEVKALFVLGASKTALPKISVSEGILTDDERETLNFELAPTVKQAGIQKEFAAVALLSAPTELLYLSYPVSDIGGETVEPSQMIYDLLESFPRLDRQNNLVQNNELLYISSPEATIHKLLLKMADGGHLNPLWEKVRLWYEKNGGFEEKLKIIDTAAEFKALSAHLSAENAKLLYEDYTNYSISRIEKYFQCPFGYFLDNGLKVKEREIWEIGSTDTGSLLHWAVCEYCKKIDGDDSDLAKKKENWKSLTDEQSDEIISSIIKRAGEELELPEYEAGKTRNLLLRMEKALKKSVAVINLSMKNSKYVGAAYETEFSEKEIKNTDGAVKIKGIIDRIDIFEDFETGKAYIRIIDYKSGKKGYSLERILNRVDLQLAVYAIAAMDMYRQKAFDGFSGELEPVVKGIFYDKINKNIIECNFAKRNSAQELRLLDSRLDGVLFTTETGKGKSAYFETKDAENMDYEVETLGMSRYFKAEKKQKGAGLNKRHSSVESDVLGDRLLTHVRNSLIEADLKIKSGDVEVSPYKYTSKDDSACKYCPYSVICAPDREKTPCRKRERSAKEIIEEITGGVNDE